VEQDFLALDLPRRSTAFSQRLPFHVPAQELSVLGQLHAR
jgi:hypothetical protein